MNNNPQSYNRHQLSSVPSMLPHAAHQYVWQQCHLMNQPFNGYYNNTIAPQIMSNYNSMSPYMLRPNFPTVGNASNNFGTNYAFNQMQGIMQPRFASYPPMSMTVPHQLSLVQNQANVAPTAQNEKSKVAETRLIKCDYCPKKVARDKMYEHRGRCALIRSHACLFCPKRFEKRYGLKQHILTHKETFGKICNSCLRSINEVRELVHCDQNAKKPTAKCHECIQFYNIYVSQKYRRYAVDLPTETPVEAPQNLPIANLVNSSDMKTLFQMQYGTRQCKFLSKKLMASV
uniref:C2H2-type domain-containing protein n=1 Tax=Panagrellus redivivus TaxID=6233 RepID=A0A7E4VJ84_PANRE